jgi:hypothetical protein
LLFGDPNVIQIRKVFGENSKKAKIWEDKVLARLKVKDKSYWLNGSNNYSFREQDESWNLGLTKSTCPSLAAAALKISKYRKGRKPSEQTRRKMAKTAFKRKEQNSWGQLLQNPIYSHFNDYADFLTQVMSCYVECKKIPLVIARKINATEGGVKTVLTHQNLDFIVDQRFSKLLKNYGDQFSSYEDYENQIIELHKNGMTPWQISDLLNINGHGVTEVFKKKNLIWIKAKTGPKSIKLQ